MINKEIFNVNHIYFGVNVSSQKEAFKYIAQKFVEGGVSNDVKDCYKGLKHREKEGSTGFNDGIAIPHARIKAITKAGVFVFKFTTPLQWESIDKSLVKIAIALAIPDDVGGDQHIKILSSIARKLVDQKFRHDLISANDKEELFKLINKVQII
ncbi:MAG: PTS sugar transporter subunit IIA [Mycoplasmataceae bacterium]|jgi:PTS system fructose-specific IIA component|nr:PTS sugar transporter subunit IIA [Mycoplasmataceae bacterium]